MSDESTGRSLTLGHLLGMPSWEWPEDATELVLHGLRSPDPEEVLAATSAAVHVMDDTVAMACLDLIEQVDGSPEIRARAALALGPALEDGDVMGFEEAADAMLSQVVWSQVQSTCKRVYHDAITPKYVRRKVLEAAVRARAAWHEAAIRAAYQSTDEDWKVTAVFCMGFVTGFEEEILSSLESDVGAVRFEAIRAAGIRELADAGVYILEVASNPSEPVDLRVEAVEALAHINPPSTYEVLEELAHGRIPELSDAAEEALEELAVWEFAGDRVDSDFLDELDKAFDEFDDND